jgi:DinB superfamily
MRRSLNELPALVRSLSPDRLLRHPGEGEWTIAAAIAHLADVELMYGARVRLILTENRPRLAAYDQERWWIRSGELQAASRRGSASPVFERPRRGKSPHPSMPA